MSSTTLIFITIIMFLLVTQSTLMLEVNATSAGCVPRERKALLKLKASFSDPSNRLSSWNTSSNDCCTWAGVECDRLTGHVVGLDLQSEGYDTTLSSTKIDSSISELMHLHYLDLSRNDFQRSSIPSSLGLLNQLQHLNLSDGHFHGIVPHHLSNLSQLNVLDLGVNYQLVVDDFMWASRLTLLSHLDMSGVDLNGAKHLHKVLDMLPSIEVLRLSHSNLENRNLRRAFVNTSLSNIQVLDLSENSFDGELPYFLGNLTSLIDLDLSYNHKFNSCSQVSLNRLTNLVRLDLSDNSFDGELPYFLGNLTSLTYLDLSYNNYNSCNQVNLNRLTNLVRLDLSSNFVLDCNLDSISQVLGNNCHMESLDLTLNSFSGDISELFLLNLSRCPNHKLATLNLGENNIHGQLPEQIGAFRKLESLRLYRNNIRGPIPPTIGNLRAMEHLDLYENQLSGVIPSSIGNLSALKQLDLHSNRLSGLIPSSFSNLSALTELDLNSNQLFGLIPPSIGNLSALLLLNLNSNQLSGVIPSSMGNLSALTKLDLSSNQLSGIPSSIGNLSSLENLDLSSNQLSGVIPLSIGNLSALRSLDLQSNQISGVDFIPSSSRNISALGDLDLSSNQLTEISIPIWLWQRFDSIYISNNDIEGPIPDSLCRNISSSPTAVDLSSNRLSGALPDCWWKLSQLVILSDNKLSGVIPDSIGESCALQDVLMNNNSFTGELPSTLGNCSALLILDVSRNHLSGNLPQFWAHLNNLAYLALSSNELSGDIPESFGGDCSLQWLQLNNNAFTGELPSTLRHCTYLRVLDVGGNKISGELPKWIGSNLLDLKALRLTNNDFYGTIPSGFCKLSKLQILDLSNNHLTGNVPRCFGNFSVMAISDLDSWDDDNFESLEQVIKGSVMEYISTLPFVVTMDLSNNNLTGEIPSGLTRLADLISFNLSRNHLSGHIPQRIGDMKSLLSLDLSNNNLMGEIPESLSDLNFLSVLNLSHNKLTGQIPTGQQLQTLVDPSIYEGNPGLCGDPLPKKCHEDKASNVPNTESHEAEDEEGNLDTIWFVGVVISGFASGFWGAIGVVLFKRSWRIAFFGYVDEKIARLLGRR